MIHYSYSYLNPLQGYIRGGIDVNAVFQYYIEPNACLQGSVGPSCTSASIDTCLQLYHGYPSYVNIVPWWQRRFFKRWVRLSVDDKLNYSYIASHSCCAKCNYS